MAMAVDLLALVALFYLGYGWVDPVWLSRIEPRIGGLGLMWFTYYAPYFHLFEFIGGCLAAHAFLLMGSVATGKPAHRSVCVAAALATAGFLALPGFLIAIRYYPQQTFHLHLMSRVVATTVISLLLVLVARYETLLSRLLRTRPMLLGGECSCSIYLLHPNLLVLFTFHPIATFPPFPGEFYVRLAIMAASISVLSWGSYMRIERPGRICLRRRLGHLGPPRTVAPIVELHEVVG